MCLVQIERHDSYCFSATLLVTVAICLARIPMIRSCILGLSCINSCMLFEVRRCCIAVFACLQIRRCRILNGIVLQALHAFVAACFFLEACWLASSSHGLDSGTLEGSCYKFLDTCHVKQDRPYTDMPRLYKVA